MMGTNQGDMTLCISSKFRLYYIHITGEENEINPLCYRITFWSISWNWRKTFAFYYSMLVQRLFRLFRLFRPSIFIKNWLYFLNLKKRSFSKYYQIVFFKLVITVWKLKMFFHFEILIPSLEHDNQSAMINAAVIYSIIGDANRIYRNIFYMGCSWYSYRLVANEEINNSVITLTVSINHTM